jgi:hypothetical protein
MHEIKTRISNDTFDGQEPTGYNACVGNNGFQDTEAYIRGYIEAAITLLEGIVRRHPHESKIDDIVYPIAFCIRHTVELCIKGSIESLRTIKDNQTLREYKLTNKHDIYELWSFYKIQSEKIDNRYQDINARMEPYVLDICEIDPNGQTFRYPHDLSENKHLTKTPVINLLRLKNRFSELANLIDELLFAHRSLSDEYYHGTHTEQLSRYDLFLISKKLPNIDQWAKPDFALKKKQIRKEFFIKSNRSLSKALDIIKNHYEFSQIIGIENKITHSSAEDLELYLESWKTYYNQPQIELSMLTLETLFEDSELERELLKKCLDSIPIEALAEIHALYELGRFPQPIYSEQYSVLLKRNLIELQHAQQEDDIYSPLGHIFTKTNTMEAIGKSLKILGQKTILDHLTKKFPEISTHSKIDLKDNYQYPLKFFSSK